MTRSLWKGPFVKTSILNQIYKKNNGGYYNFIKIWCKNSVIFPCFVGCTFEVYNGKKFILMVVQKNMVGFKLGEFILTRKLTKHKKSD